MAYGKNAYRGKWRPRNPDKYRGDINNITYRSSWELKAFNWCDTRSNLITWSSEEVVIPYKSPVDGRMHRYFMDLKFTIQNADGTKTTYLAEIKPKKFTQEPARQKRKTKAYLEEVVMWGTNQAKWAAAVEYAADRNWKFIILTEIELGIK